MFILLRNFLHDLFFSPDAARGYLRGFAFAVATLASTFATLFSALPAEQVQELLVSPKKLVLYSLPSVLAGFAGMVRAGDRTPQAVKDLVEKAKNGD